MSIRYTKEIETRERTPQIGVIRHLTDCESVSQKKFNTVHDKIIELTKIMMRHRRIKGFGYGNDITGVVNIQYIGYRESSIKPQIYVDSIFGINSDFFFEESFYLLVWDFFGSNYLCSGLVSDITDNPKLDYNYLQVCKVCLPVSNKYYRLVIEGDFSQISGSQYLEFKNLNVSGVISRHLPTCSIVHLLHADKDVETYKLKFGMFNGDGISEREKILINGRQIIKDDAKFTKQFANIILDTCETNARRYGKKFIKGNSIVYNIIDGYIKNEYNLINESDLIYNVVDILKGHVIDDVQGEPLPILILRAIVYEHTLLLYRKRIQKQC